jgi:tetratricopeptide (TPR) repeat protein
LEESQRRQREPADNCLACHMPRGDTDIPHIAFTNHRIVRQTAPRPADLGPGRVLPVDASGRVPALVPTDDVPGLAVVDQRRNLGLAYFLAGRNPVYVRKGYAGTFRERARELLEGVDAMGLPDAETAMALADLYAAKNRDLATAYAKKVLRVPDLSTETRVWALLMLAGSEMQDRQFDSASQRLEEVVRLQRAASDWYFLGVCCLEMDQPSRALAALRQSLAIRPDRSAVHARLADAYARLGDVQRANEHREKARWLFKEHGD